MNQTTVRDVCARARQASYDLATASRKHKDAALVAMAEALRKHSEQIVAANAGDVQAARAAGTGESDVDRLTLDDDRVDEMAAGLEQLAGLVDPIGEVVRGYVLPNGLELRQVRVPLGVVGIIYEARPNVTADAAGICLKSGNAALLRGSSSAARSNAAIVEVLREAIESSGLPTDAVQLVSGDRSAVAELMTARGLVDVLIPRGGAGLIRTVVEGSTVPVIETGAGNCHLYADADVDVEQAVPIVVNAKVQRPSVCNSLETLLVHRDAAPDFLAAVLPPLAEAAVAIHGSPEVVAVGKELGIEVDEVTDNAYATEHHGLELSIGVVDSPDDAVRHIRRFGTAHTDGILTRSQAAANRFVAAVDSAAVVVNASTRFSDGGEFGFGAEIGISTQKLHARGPMGLPEMTSTKYVLIGDGQVRT